MRAVNEMTPRSSTTMVDQSVEIASTSPKSLLDGVLPNGIDMEKDDESNTQEPSIRTTNDDGLSFTSEDHRDMVTWDGPADPLNPQNWSVRYKWLITIVCSLMTINV